MIAADSDDIAAREGRAAADLQKTILDEAFWVLGLNQGSVLRRTLEVPVKPLVGRFAGMATRFDADVAERGLQKAALLHAKPFLDQVTTTGVEELPAEGPLVIVANHPGAADVLAIAGSVPRDDLKIIASNVNLVRYLPAFAEHVIFMSDGSVVGDAHSRMGAARASIRHLKDGGSLLVFASGRVDPDPAVEPARARAEFGRWSESSALFLRRVPESRIAVALVSGVLSPGWFHSPVTRWQKEPHYKQKVAEVFQVLQQIIWPGSLPLQGRVAYSPAFTLEQIRGASEGDSAQVVPFLIRQAEQLLEQQTAANLS